MATGHAWGRSIAGQDVFRVGRVGGAKHVGLAVAAGTLLGAIALGGTANGGVSRSDATRVRLLHGTNDCSYYTERCAENGGSYYCSSAPWWCNHFPKPPGREIASGRTAASWSPCTRQCLQDTDRDRRDRDRKDNVSEVPNNSGPWNPFNPSSTDHLGCYLQCLGDHVAMN